MSSCQLDEITSNISQTYQQSSLSIQFCRRIDSILLALQMMVDRTKITRHANPQIESRTIKRLSSFEQSCFTLRARPMMISTTPTMIFPHTIDNVDSMSTFTGSPRVIAITSLEASMLKAPPKKNPVIPDKAMQRMISKERVKKRTKQRLIMRQEQNKLQLFMFLFNITTHCCPPVICSYSLLGTLFLYLQKQPSKAEPKTVATLNKLGAQVAQSLYQRCERQVDIHSRNPQRMDLSSPIDKRYILFQFGRAISLLNLRNCLNLATLPRESVSVSSLKSISSFLGFSFSTRNTSKDINNCKVAPINITYSQSILMTSSTNIPRKKPSTLPTSPFADQMPKIDPQV